MNRPRWARFGLVLALALAVSACESDNSGAPTYVGEEKSVRLSAGEAGGLTVGAATLELPTGALREDTEISVSVKSKAGLPDAKNVAIDVYDYGPDGTTFEKPVKLSFDMEGVKVPKDRKVVVAYLEDDDWKVLSTTVKEGKASAETTHFTPFTLIFVLDDDGAQQTGGQCGAEFKACGGDLVGTWEYTAGCLTAPKGALDELGSAFGMCDEPPVASFTIDLVGTVRFGSDGAFEADQKVTVSGGVRVAESCLDELADSMGASSLSCTDVGGAVDGKYCVLGGGEPDVSEHSTTGTYSTSGTNVTVMDSESDPADPVMASAYCVQGDTLTLRIVEVEEGTAIYYTARRK